MYFSRSIVLAAVLGFAAATSHGEGMGMGGEGSTKVEASTKESNGNKQKETAMNERMTSTVLAAAVSETKASTTAGAMAHSSTVTVAAEAPAATGAAAPAESGINTHVVQVGAGGALTFSPPNVIAAAGDLVQFQFYPKNHSVVQSTFDQPCVPIQNVLANKTDAFFSGFMPTAANASKMLTYTIRVMDTKPVWFYCSQAKHCQGGMVGAINAVTSGNKTVEAFAALAKGATENLSPGQAPGGATESGTPGAASSGVDTGAAATGTGGLVASTSSPSNPAQQTTNAAPGRFADVGRQSYLGLGLGGLAAFLML